MDILCHYTNSMKSNLILESLQLRFGNISDSNDPIEIKEINFGYNGSDEDTRKMITDDLQNYLDSILTVLCFSKGEFPFENTDFMSKGILLFHNIDERPPFYLPRSWALYGGNHEGVCYIFDKNVLLEEIKRQIDKYFMHVDSEVSYKDFLHDFSLCYMSKSYFFEEDNIKNYGQKHVVQEYLKNHAYENYLIKDIDWRDEREYRIVCWNKFENNTSYNKYVDIKKALIGIVLGLKHADKDFINNAKHFNIPIYKLKFDEFIFMEEIE